MTDAVLLRRDEDMSQKKWEGNPLQVSGAEGRGCPQLDGADGKGRGSLWKKISMSPASFFLTYTDISEICPIKNSQVREPKSHLWTCPECSLRVSRCSRSRLMNGPGQVGWERRGQGADLIFMWSRHIISDFKPFSGTTAFADKQTKAQREQGSYLRHTATQLAGKASPLLAPRTIQCAGTLKTWGMNPTSLSPAGGRGTLTSSQLPITLSPVTCRDGHIADMTHLSRCLRPGYSPGSETNNFPVLQKSKETK